MIKSSKLENLILEFMEKILDANIKFIDKNKNFYHYAIVNIAEFLKISKITLMYENSQSYATLLVHNSPIYTNGLNVLYDSLDVCDNTQIVSF